MFNPTRSSIIESVTTDNGKETYRLIKITRIIAQHFMKRAKEDEYIANEMRIALKEADLENV
jgi:IS30 family transposase